MTPVRPSGEIIAAIAATLPPPKKRQDSNPTPTVGQSTSSTQADCAGSPQLKFHRSFESKPYRSHLFRVTSGDFLKERNTTTVFFSRSESNSEKFDGEYSDRGTNERNLEQFSLESKASCSRRYIDAPISFEPSDQSTYTSGKFRSIFTVHTLAVKNFYDTFEVSAAKPFYSRSRARGST